MKKDEYQPLQRGLGRMKRFRLEAWEGPAGFSKMKYEWEEVGEDPMTVLKESISNPSGWKYELIQGGRIAVASNPNVSERYEDCIICVESADECWQV